MAVAVALAVRMTPRSNRTVAHGSIPFHYIYIYGALMVDAGCVLGAVNTHTRHPASGDHKEWEEDGAG